ncbi:MAG TPA: histidine kinase [Steroidobacteraceae bacterium]|jgi:two-component system LytT family sensor kinase|nr:histidine kinase [Steroidobacteraceae bacterium]
MTPAHLSELKPGWLIWPSGRQLSHKLLFWLLQTGGWLAFGLMMFGYALARESALQAFFDVLILIATGFGLTALYRQLYGYWRRRGVAPIRLSLYVLLLSAVGAPVWFEPQVLLTWIAASVKPSLVRSLPSFTFIPVDTWLFEGFVLLTWSLLYFGVNGWISLQLERRRAARAEALAQSARLQALQSQLEPHFLFNTLNGISSLVVEGRSEAATTMIALLSEFLRLALQTVATPQITVTEEMSFVRHYLEIQKIRFGERLSFRIDVAPETSDALVPTLLLQPLVENALRHGILARADGGSVTISVRAQAGMLRLRVEDDGPGLRRSNAASKGLGLSNTATRLSELYGHQASFTVGRGSNGGVAVDIGIPLQLIVSAARVPVALGA